MSSTPTLDMIRMRRREADTRAAFARFEKRREIALSTVRNLAIAAEERAALTPTGSADRVALYAYADELWRAHTHLKKAQNTPTVFALTTSVMVGAA